MKSIKYLLAAFVVSAMFASCAKEEMVVAPENQTNGFVGEELIGTGMVVDFTADPSTKVTGGDWDANDKLGLGWVVTTSYGTAQLEKDRPTEDNLFANHMFQMNADGALVTKGNIYKGWHFGYYPFQYQETMAEKLVVDHNPKQTLKGGEDERKSTALHLSPLRFLTKTELDANLQFKSGLKIPMYNVFKTIHVVINPSEEFVNSADLKDLKVKSININAGDSQPVFACNQVSVYPSQLAAVVAKTDADGKVVKENGIVQIDADKTQKAFYQSLEGTDGTLARTGTPNGALETDYHSTLTTVVENNDIKLNGVQTLRIHTLPTKIDLTSVKKNIEFTISVEGGYFKVKYTDKKASELTAAEKANNAAIDEFVAGYKNGNMSAYYTDYTNSGVAKVAGISLDVELTPDMFTPDFTNIKSESEWNSAVKVANALGMKKAEFTIAKTSDDKYWRFTDVDKDGNLINLPTGELFVKGQPMVLAADGEWPAEGITLQTSVNVESTLTVNGTFDLTEAYAEAGKKKITVTESGVILAGPESCISNEAHPTLENNGRIIVEYGAYVYPRSGKEGVIAYEVSRTTYNDVKKINTMIKGGNLGTSANVNTLILKTALDLNALEVAGVVDGDRYDDMTSYDKFLHNLKDIDVELNGGSLVHKLVGPNAKVKNIIAVGGTNTIDDVMVVNNITVNEGAVLNINNTNAEKATSYFSENVVNEGTLNVNVCLNVKTIDNEAGVVSVAKGSHIYYSEADGYTQGGTVTGSVNYGVCDEFVVAGEASLLDVIENAAAGSTITLDSDITLVQNDALFITKDLTFNLNGKTIENKTNTTNHCQTFYVNADGIKVVIKGNGTVKATGEVQYTFPIWVNKGELVIEDGNFTSTPGAGGTALVYASTTGKITINGGTFKAGKPSVDMGNEYVALNIKDSDVATASIVVKGGKFYKFNPADNKADGPSTNYVETGYKSTKDGDWYVVTKNN